MPSVRTTQQVPANGTIQNLLTGRQFEYLTFDAEVEVAITEATGAGVTECDVAFGPEIQIENAPIATEVNPANGPRLPDNIIASGVAAAGSQLRVTARETNGTPTDVTLQVFIRPLV